MINGLSTKVFSEASSLKKLIYVMILLRILCILISFILPIVGPHEWRQYDTLGLTLRFYINIFESLSSEYPFYLPAVLQAGDSSGINPTEFPLLYLLFSPFFSFGQNLGRAIISLLLFVINTSLLLWSLSESRNMTFFNKKLSDSFLLIPIFSFSLIFFGKFMPDMLSVLLVLTSIIVAYKNNSLVKPFLIASLGLLIKPTSIIVFSLLLGNGSLKKLKPYLWSLGSIAITLLYYKVINPIISNYSDDISLFAVKLKPLEQTLKELSTEYYHFVDIFLLNSMGKFGFAIYALFILINRKKIDLFWHLKVLVVIILQVIFLSLLSGNHPFIHNYYYLGTTPFLCLLFYDLLKELFCGELSCPKLSRFLIIIVLIAPIIDQSYREIKPLIKPNRKVAWGYRSQCLELISNTKFVPWNTGYHFRSPHQMYPELGLCFGEIQNAKKTQYGFFPQSYPLPKNCIKIYETRDLYLVNCG